MRTLLTASDVCKRCTVQSFIYVLRCTISLDGICILLSFCIFVIHRLVTYIDSWWEFDAWYLAIPKCLSDS